MWVSSRREECASSCPADLLDATYGYPTDMVDEWLVLFVLEARREYYPPLTVQNLLAALFRVYEANRDATVPSFMNKSERERHYPMPQTGTFVCFVRVGLVWKGNLQMLSQLIWKESCGHWASWEFLLPKCY